MTGAGARLAGRPTIVAVVAAARNRVIGADGGMPWRLPSDLKRYRALTMGKPMIMGRKTLDSIGRVLDGRDTIVLTRSGSVPYEGAHVAGDPEQALALAEDRARSRGADEIVIAGGAEIYRLFWDRIEQIRLTEVDAAPDGDARFPAIDPAIFAPVETGAWTKGERDSAPTRAIHYERVGGRRSDHPIR